MWYNLFKHSGAPGIKVSDDLFRGSCVMAIKVAKGCGFVNHRGWIYMTTMEAGKELIWMRHFLSELGMKQEKFVLHCDNQSAIHLAKNVAYHSRTKHIQRRYHWLCERVEENEFVLEKIHTHENGSDMPTKVLSMDKLVACRRMTGLVDSPPTGVKGEFVM